MRPLLEPRTSFRLWRSWFRVVFTVSVIGCIPLAAARRETEQGNKKFVEVGPQHREDAVMITRVQVGDFVVPCGLLVAQNEMQPSEEFEADSDWLKNMTITMFNRTEKKIVAFTITLGFPETGDGKVAPQHVSIIQVGRIPDNAAYSGLTGRPLPQRAADTPIAWFPEQEYVIQVGSDLEDIKRNVEHVMPLDSVSRCHIRIGPFFFEDGMNWYMNSYSVPDPARPGTRIRMADDFFPGNAGKHWPPMVVRGNREPGRPDPPR